MLRIWKGMVMSQEPSERDQRDGQKQGDNVFLLFQTYRKVTSLTEESGLILKRNGKL